MSPLGPIPVSISSCHLWSVGGSCTVNQYTTLPRSLRRHRHSNTHPPPLELLIQCVAHHRTLAVFAEQSAPTGCHSQSPILVWCDPLEFFCVRMCHLNVRVVVRSTERDVIFVATYLVSSILISIFGWIIQPKIDTYQLLCTLTTVKHIGIPIYTQHQWLSLPQPWGWPNVRSKHVAYVSIIK